jgi:hypothetical protein
MTELLGASFALADDSPDTARLAAASPATLLMHDTSNPAGKDVGAQVVGWYLGGATPHVWTLADRMAQTARWQLPIWVPSNPLTGVAEGASCAEAARAAGVKPGVTIGWDLETHQWAGEVTAAAAVLALAGYHLMPYGSAGFVFANPPVAGYWVADWTGQPHLYPHAGVVATQYAANVTLANGVPVDKSLIVASVPLIDTRPPAPPPGGLADLHNAANHLIAAGQLLAKITHLP